MAEDAAQQEAGLGEEETPCLPSDLLRLAPGARRVTDADEELFLLYTLNAPPSGRMGLGPVDHNRDLLAVTFDLADDGIPEVVGVSAEHGSSPPIHVKVNASRPSKQRAGKKSGRTKAAAHRTASTVVSAVVHQDSTSLRSTAGDTGSVIWRSSVRLAACLTRQLHRSQRVELSPILCKHALERGRHDRQPWTVLELGSGTGVLPAILRSYLSQATDSSTRLRWCATDQEAMLPLLQRNLSGGSHGETADGSSQVPQDAAMSVRVSALDWLVASRLLRQGPRVAYAHGQDHFRSEVLGSVPQQGIDSIGDGASNYPDLIIAVDCVFNPALFAPLVDTLDLFTRPDHTIVLILVELRSSDATLAFLETWLRQDHEERQAGSGTSEANARPRWQIWNVASEQLAQGGSGLAQGYAAWIAWKS